jgi:hypothetical protein
MLRVLQYESGCMLDPCQEHAWTQVREGVCPEDPMGATQWNQFRVLDVLAVPHPPNAGTPDPDLWLGSWLLRLLKAQDCG